MNSRLCWTFAITSLALFAFTLDRLVVAIALPAIRADLGAGVAGGVLAGSVGWRAIFWLNVPLGLALMPLARARLAETYGPRRRLDLTGVALGSAGLSGFVWAVIRAGAAGWTSAETSLALGGGVSLLTLFVCWEMRTPAPMLPWPARGSRCSSHR
jgi:hypothetical protein